jgi:hypothetical protein
MKENDDNIELSSVLIYRNKNLIDAFIVAYDVSYEVAEDIFEQMLKFLWLSQSKLRKHHLGVIDNPILIIDEMWHMFLLFTRDYSHFCMKYFGRFIHHVPITQDEIQAERAAFNHKSLEKIKENKRIRYHLIFDLFDRETFIKWYFEYPEKYSKSKIREIRLK